MTTTVHPHNWSEFFSEFLWYFELMILPHLVAFAVGCAVIACLRRKSITYLQRVVRFGLFMTLLLVVSSFFNGLWSCLVWGKLYISTDYVFDFMPFWPITQRVIDMPFGDMRGQLFGVSLFKLQLVWLLFAVGTWVLTLFLYRLITSRPFGLIKPTQKLVASSI